MNWKIVASDWWFIWIKCKTLVPKVSKEKRKKKITRTKINWAKPSRMKLTQHGVRLGALFLIPCRSQWPRGLRRRSAASRLLRSWVRIPPGAWMFVCCECCVLSGRGLCDELITRPEESYRLWCVVVCDLETSRMKRRWPALGRSATVKKKNLMTYNSYSHQCCHLAVAMFRNTKGKNIPRTGRASFILTI